MAPIIGITAGFNNSAAKHFLTDYYVQAIQALGGIPVILPAVGKEQADRFLDLVDGIIFSGGSDVDPQYFGEPPLRGMGEITPNRDEFEIYLAQQMLASSKPALGICRGIQILNIAAGGDIYQDIKGVTEQEHDQQAPKWYSFHLVEIEHDSLLFKILGRSTVKVNSFHHQSVRNLGTGFQKVAWSADGLTEAIEYCDQNKFILGVQWHPECCWEKCDHAQALLKYFVNKAKKL